MSDDVKEVGCANSDSDAKMENLVPESVSKERAVFFAAVAPVIVGINKPICDDTHTFVAPARSPSTKDPERRKKNRPPSSVSSSSCGNRQVPAQMPPQGHEPSSPFAAAFVSPNQMHSGYAILSG